MSDASNSCPPGVQGRILCLLSSAQRQSSGLYLIVPLLKIALHKTITAAQPCQSGILRGPLSQPEQYPSCWKCRLERLADKLLLLSGSRPGILREAHRHPNTRGERSCQHLSLSYKNLSSFGLNQVEQVSGGWLASARGEEFP
jgi:hypothetical protein